MAEANNCLGHGIRVARKSKISKMLSYPVQRLDENQKVLIKKGPVSAVMSLKEVEEKYKSKPEWKVIEESLMTRLNIPTLIISVNLGSLSALKDLGIKLPGNAEIDLIMAYVSDELLHVVVFEVKRADTNPWQAKPSLPNKPAVNKAENQLTKDLDVMMTILAGIAPSLIRFHTLACFPDFSISELQSIICDCCLETGVVGQEDLEDINLLQRKTQVLPDKLGMGNATSP